MTQLEDRWPGIALEPVMRLRVLADALPGVALQERTLRAPFDVVWSFIADLERSVPSFDPLVSSVRVLERSDAGEPVRLRAWPSPFPFRVELTEGLCLMSSRVFMVAMAAQPRGRDETLFAHLEGIPVSGSRFVQAVERPVVRALRRVHRRNVRRDLDGIERSLRAQA